MKAILRWSAALGILGSITLTSLLGGSFPALALPPAQVVETLGVTPVFYIVSSDNKLLFVSAENNQRVAPRFLSQQDAQQFLTNLQQSNPQIANGARIAVSPLGELYQLDIENANQQQDVQFQYVPTEQQARNATTLDQSFAGAPLFYATVGQESVTIQQNGETVVPFFFEKEGLMRMVDRFKQAQPDRASQVQIEVVALENVIETLRTSSDNNLSQLVLVPSEASLQFIESVQQQIRQQNSQNRQTAPNRR
ncbi:MAG: Tic22 family protein [Cyanobacteriota bacterium]|nr:Tic22 family protein [Cyanobacteriota bacterium]